MRTAIWLSFALFLAGCSDVLPDKQCDPARRCSAEDVRVCGQDGQWYECGLVAECEEVPVLLTDTLCTQGTAEPPVCPAIACDQTRPGPDGCPVCDDGCNTPTCDAEGCGLVLPPGGGCATCVCEPLSTCEPLDRAACLADPQCVITADDADNGCDICVCDSTATCPRDFCNNFCPNGYLIVDGCASCECFEPCNFLPECDLFCPTGNTQDPATGCFQSCECVAETCNDVGCRLFCEFGFRRDGSGCEACECRGTPCFSNEECGLDETCVMDTGPMDEFGGGECVQLAQCTVGADCPDGGPCGFYFRQDCCPPFTTCTDDLAACPAVCLLDVGDLPHEVVF